MNFISICSGIEAASVAFEPLGWKAIGFSEIEPFPCAVLAHHYPDVPNFGDMTKFREWPESVFANADAIVGGPPCQAFSIAGLRNGLEDARGNLTLVYVELINHADLIRYKHGKPPVITIYENVPGLFSDKTGAFGCFLGSLAGEDGALVPPGGRWTDAGCVFGPQRTIAWRVVDAQFFGVAQRRRRVFVVASARAGFDPAAVLFEFDGVRRDIAPSREAGEEVTPTIRAGATNGSPGHGQRSGDSRDELIVPVASTGSISHYLNAGGSAGAKWPADIAPTLNAHFGEKQGLEDQHINGGAGLFVLHGTQDPCTDKHLAFAMGRNSGQENVVALSVALRGREGGATAELGDEVGNCLRASSGGGDKPHVLCETLYNKGFNHGGLYASTQETHAGKILRTLREAVGEEAFAQWGLGILGSLQSPEILRQALHGLSIRPAAFSRSWVVHCALSRSENGSGWLLQSLREAGCERCASQGWEPSEQLAGKLGAYLSELSQPGAQAARLMRDLWFASEGVGLLQQALLAVQEVGRSAGHKGQSVLRGSEGRRAETPEAVPSAGMQCEVSRERVLHQACAAGKARDSREGATEQERSGKGRVGETPFAVRRLTVEECEFLQGFPRGYSKIPWRKKPADDCPDGPRYKALGNSMAVPCMFFIGSRIDAAVNAEKTTKKVSA